MATNFTESQTPIEYAKTFLNRFVNAAGGAEKRQGDTLVSGALPTGGIVTGVHEYVRADDQTRLYASSDGAIFRYDGSASWTSVYAFTTAARVRHVQMDDRLIFYNGYDRPVYIQSDSLTASFRELIALMEEGTGGSATSAAALTDADVANWISETVVTNNDLVYNQKRGTYALVTGVVSARVTHTHMSAAATGFGNTTTPPGGFAGIGGDAAAGDAYRIIDLIELNVVDAQTIPDNVATIVSAATSGSTTRIYVSADRVSDWTQTEIRVGDVVGNTTRNAGSFVSDVSASFIEITPAIAGTVAGDSITLHKSAMPIPKWIHVHFGRAYFIDARNARNIIISGANDPQDVTVDSSSLESITLAIGAQQPGADPAKAIATFQTFLIVGTERAIFAFRGTSPSELVPAGMFPQGLVSPDSFINTGNDLAFISPDGLLSVSLLLNTSNLQRSNLSEPIKNELRELIKRLGEGDIQGLNYQRRSWVILKLGAVWYVYNYANLVLDDGRLAAGASWAKFTGDLCVRRVIYPSHSSDIILGGAGGKVYRFDQGIYSDAGMSYRTEYATGWLSLEEPRVSNRVKSGAFIVPSWEIGGDVVYTIEAAGDYDLTSLDTAVVTAKDELDGTPIGVKIVGGAPIGGGKTSSPKIPLRWRGEQFRITFSTEDTEGPDVLAGFSIYGQIHGRR